MAERQNGGGGFSSFRDMFDGGGAGRSGDRFEGGGFISDFGNAMGGPSMFGGGEGGGNFGSTAGRAIGGMMFGPLGMIGGGLLGNMMGGGNSGYGYTDAAGNPVSARMDMMDGGGRGMAGDTFQGGLLSSILNAMGARPMGYDARQQAMTAMPEAPATTPEVTRRALAPTMSSRAMPRPMRPAAPPISYAPPMQPSINVMPDGETFLRQNIAALPAINRPMVDMPTMTSMPRMSASMAPQGYAGRAPSPYEQMLERFQLSGNPVMTTAPGSLRPTGILPR